jgi:hypothetical protein
MVHYIRFLKPPKIQITSTNHVTVRSLITITNDLGDDFYQGDLALDAELFPSGQESTRPFVQKDLMWTSGMRTLWIIVERIPLNFQWPVQLHITPSKTLADTPLLRNFPDILTAWSENFGIGLNFEAGKRIERRLNLISDSMLSIFEDPGESIARHVW